MVKSKILLFIFALSFGCHVENTKPRSPIFVTISDGNPIQFWVNGIETFNEKDIPGVFSKCFCQPFQCDDIIRTQFKGTIGVQYWLGILSEENGLHLLFFTETVPGIFDLSFIPSSIAVCDEHVTLLIFNGVNLTDYLLEPVSWSDGIGGPGVGGFDTKNSTQFIETALLSSEHKQAYQSISVNTDETVTINYVVNIPFAIPANNSIIIRFVLTDISGNELSIENINSYNTVFTSSGSYSISAVFKLTDSISATRLYLKADHPQGSSTGILVSVAINAGDVVVIHESLSEAKSDCINITSEIDETILINYSNHRNYAGLNYSDISPDPNFNLRVPAIFFEPSFPQEQEVIELSDSKNLQLNAELKQKRLLQVKQAPVYFHKKVIIALSHQFVYIDGQYWVKNDSYDIVSGNKRNPLRQATCYLTERDTIDRNVL